MAAKKELPRTVSFFEIVEEKHPTNERMPHAEWQSILTVLAAQKLSARVWNGPDKTLIGEPLVIHDESIHLKLMKVRDQASWLSVYNEDAESIADLDLEDKTLLLETSIVAFLNYGNIIGIIQGTASSPTSTSLAEWINGIGFLQDGLEVATQPLVSHDAVGKLNDATEATRVEVKMHTSKAGALEKRGARLLSSVLRRVQQTYGAMTVTVILQASRAKDGADARRTMREELDVVLAASDNDEVAKASAKLVYIDSSDKARSEEVDFVKQKITAKRMVPTTSADGSSIRNTSAVTVILAVAKEHESDLKSIVGHQG